MKYNLTTNPWHVMRGEKKKKIYFIDLNFVYETFFLSGLHLPLLAQVEIRITNTP